VSGQTVDAARLSDDFAQVAKLVEPAVVSIDTKGKMPEATARGRTAPGDSDDIMEFFRRQLPRRPSYSVGSGFIVDKAGYILTNAHVVENAVRINVKLDSGEEYLAEVVGADEETDVAVLKIDAGRDLPFVVLGDSDKARVGEWVLAIGSPFGLTRTVTAGIISQVRRETPYASVFQRFIQTDAAINRGNSGGPLVNMKGEVIGINSQIATSTGDYNGVGFALPSSEAASVYGQIRSNGKVRRGYLGVLLDSVKPEFSKVYGLNGTGGAIVTEVRDKTSPAGSAGLVAGDVIVEFDGKPIQSAQDLIAKVASTTPDRTVNIVFLRESGSKLDRRSVAMTLSERPSTSQDPAGSRASNNRMPLERPADAAKPFGLTLTEVTPALAATYKLDGQKGLIVKEINPESFIADVKISNGVDALGEGDVIQRINRVPVTSLKSFTDIVGKLKKGDAVVMHVLAFNTRSQSSQLKIVQFTVQ
jgi:serine protease Do